MHCSCRRCSDPGNPVPGRSGGPPPRPSVSSAPGAAPSGSPRSSATTPNPRRHGCAGRGRPSPGPSANRHRGSPVRGRRASSPQTAPRKPQIRRRAQSPARRTHRPTTTVRARALTAAPATRLPTISADRGAPMRRLAGHIPQATGSWCSTYTRLATAPAPCSPACCQPTPPTAAERRHRRRQVMVIPGHSAGITVTTHYRRDDQRHPANGNAPATTSPGDRSGHSARPRPPYTS